MINAELLKERFQTPFDLRHFIINVGFYVPTLMNPTLSANSTGNWNL